MKFLENIFTLIENLGYVNLFFSIIAILSLILGVYFYFKSFYRMVYERTSICLECNNYKHWQSYETKLITRFIFFNNGRKTLYKEDFKIFSIFTEKGKINDFKVLKGNNSLKINKKLKKIELVVDELDAKDFITIEVSHIGPIEFNGRIKETGKMLQTETLFWKFINIIFVCFTFVVFINNAKYYDQKNPDILSLLIGSFTIIFLLISLRIIHGLFFIPDSISSKYTSTTDKFNKEFKNKFKDIN